MDSEAPHMVPFGVPVVWPRDKLSDAAMRPLQRSGRLRRAWARS